MVKQRFGNIINLSSSAAIEANREDQLMPHQKLHLSHPQRLWQRN